MTVRSRSSGAVHPWVLPAHLVDSHPTQTWGQVWDRWERAGSCCLVPTKHC